jgi:signal transduction histidine kinase/CheY-like chemotaxis protein
MNTKDEFIPILSELNIVLAEDDETDCLLFKEALEELPLSAQLTIVNDGEQLLNLLRKPDIKLPDVIFLDLNMPKKNGFVALVAIKHNTQLQQIPIIIFSATNEHHIDKIKIEQVFKDAAHYYIRKPSQFSELKKVIYKALKLIVEKNISLPKQEHFVITDEIKIGKNYTEAVLDNISTPLLILDKNIKIKAANRAFCKKFHLDAQEIEGIFIGDLDNKQWNIPELINFLRRIIPEKYVLNNFELTYNLPTIGKLTLLVSAKKMVDNINFEKLILLSIENIAEQKQHQDKPKKDMTNFKNSDLKTSIAICMEQRTALETELTEIKLKLAQTNAQILLQTKEEEKRAAELIIANKELIFQNAEKEKRAAELIIVNKELIYQSLEKEKRASELIIAVKELIYQNEEKDKRAAERIIADKELVFQNAEKEKRAAELIVTNKEFIFQSEEREKRAAELIVANKELIFQNKEKEKRAAELNIANKEFIVQNKEKEKWAAELNVANKKLVFQSEEKEKRAAELSIANYELVFQNEEKEKRAAELSIANNELIFQNEEKEKRAAELIIANKELIFQNEEKEKRAAELISINKELEAFAYISSHDLQEPLRKIQMFSGIILEREKEKLSDKGKNYFHLIEDAANRMQTLIEDLLTFSRLSKDERIFETTNLDSIIEKVKIELREAVDAKQAIIEVTETCTVNVIVFQFHQLLHNLIGNALKFANPKQTPNISIKSSIVDNTKLKNSRLIANKTYCHITVTDNGIGFEPIYNEKIFEVFQKLHGKEEYSGTGIGLAIVKKIIENHNGIITATGELNQGATFNIYIPNN